MEVVFSLFSSKYQTRGLFSKHLTKIHLAPPPAAPSGHHCTYFENRHFLKSTPSPGRSSALGAPPEAAPGVFFQNVFENGPYFQTSVWKCTYFQTSVWKWTIFGSFYFQNRHLASFSKFQTWAGGASYQAMNFQKIPLAPPPAAHPGRCRALGGGIVQNVFENGPCFQTSVWKWTYFQTSVWKWTIFGSSFFQNRHWARFSKCHHLAGDASYESNIMYLMDYVVPGLHFW